VVSRFSSESILGRLVRLSIVMSLLLALAPLAGCVTVRPEDKEYLAEPSMTFGAEGESLAHEEHVFNNREASFGGGGVSGGGCGCN